MKKRIFLTLLAVAFCFASLAFATDTRPEKTFCWKITSKNTTVYLLGSIHLCKPEIYPLDQALTKAYEESKCLVMEADIDPEKSNLSMQDFMMKKGIYTDGSTIEDHLSKDDYKELKDFCEKAEVNLAQLGMLRPWLLTQQLVNMELAKLGFVAEASLDKHFYERAKKDKKPVKELESMAYQLELLSSFSEKIQEVLLMNTIKDFGNLESLFKKIMKAWTFGDADSMNLEVLLEQREKEPELATYYEKIFDERNLGMAAKIEEYLTTGETHFVIAGCGHLVGKKGILHLLKAKEKAYKIEQLKALGRPAKK